MTSPVAFCMNVFRGEDKLRTHIAIINNMFDRPPIFVASNGMDAPSALPANVTFDKYTTVNLGWQLGAVNSAIHALRMATTTLPDEYDLVLGQYDVYPYNAAKIRWYLAQLATYDVVARKHTGIHSAHRADAPYYMTENMLLSRRLAPHFRDQPLFDEIIHSCEETFGSIVARITRNVLEVPFASGSIFLAENETGFYHDHQH